MRQYKKKQPGTRRCRTRVHVQTQPDRSSTVTDFLEQAGETILFVFLVLTKYGKSLIPGPTFALASATIAAAAVFEGTVITKPVEPPLHPDCPANIQLNWLYLKDKSPAHEGWAAADEMFWKAHPELGYGYKIKDNEITFKNEWWGYVRQAKACKEALGITFSEAQSMRITLIDPVTH